MEKHLKIQDTCGIHNLHAMPGVIGGIVGAITAASASIEVYGHEGWVFPCLQKGNIQLDIMAVFPFSNKWLKEEKTVVAPAFLSLSSLFFC